MPRQTPENDFMRQVIDLAKMRGWKVAHFGASVRVVGKARTFVGDKDAAGFPDLILARGERLIFAELKAGKGRTSEAQVGWLKALDEANAEVYLWYPKDMEWVNSTLK